MSQCEMKLPGIFGSNVFNDKVMRERLPKDIYKSLRKTIEKGTPLTPEVASVVANAIKESCFSAVMPVNG